MTPWDFVTIWMLSGIAMAALFAHLVGVSRRHPSDELMIAEIVVGIIGGFLWAVPLTGVLSDLMKGKSLEQIREKYDQWGRE